MAPCGTTPNSSGQHPSGLATGKQKSLVGWLDLGSKIALGFSLIRKKPSVLWIHLPPDSYIDSFNVIYRVLGFCFKILMLKTLSSVRT